MTPAYWDAAPWFVKLGVRLLCEQRKGSASPFSQWIKQLPQQVRVMCGHAAATHYYAKAASQPVSQSVKLLLQGYSSVFPCQAAAANNQLVLHW